MTRMVMDPDHPSYFDDAIDNGDDVPGVDTCHHGVGFDEPCEDCEIEEEDLDVDFEPECGLCGETPVLPTGLCRECEAMVQADDDGPVG